MLRARGFAGAADLCLAHSDGHARLRLGHVAPAPETVVARTAALGAAPRALCRDAAARLDAVACAHPDGTGSVRWLPTASSQEMQEEQQQQVQCVLATEAECTAVQCLGARRYAVGTGHRVLVAAVDAAGRTARVIATRDLRVPVSSLAVAAGRTLCATAGHHVVVLRLVRAQEGLQQQEQEQEEQEQEQEEPWVLQIVDVATTPFLAGEAVFAARDTLVVRDVLRGLRVFRCDGGSGRLALVAATHGTLCLSAVAPVCATQWLAATLAGDLLCLAQPAPAAPLVAVVAALHVGELITRIVRASNTGIEEDDNDNDDHDDKDESDGDGGETEAPDSVLGMDRGAQRARLFYAGTASGRVLAVLAVTARDGTLLRALEAALAPAFSCVVGVPHRTARAPRTPGIAAAAAADDDDVVPRMVDGDLVQLAPRLAPADAARLLRPLGAAAPAAAAFAERLARVVTATAALQPPR